MKVECVFEDQVFVIDVKQDTSLGKVQKTLCRAFRQRFPASKATIVIDDQTFDEFIQRPFASCSEGSSVHVRFSDTDDPLFYDLLDRNPKHKWLH